MTRPQAEYCRDILERIARIEGYVSLGRGVFMQSELHQDAVSFCFLVIGEAVRRLDDDMTVPHPHIPWRQYARFRDVLIHRYHNTEIIVAWQVSQDELPALKEAVTAMLKQMGRKRTQALKSACANSPTPSIASWRMADASAVIHCGLKAGQ